MKHLIYNKIISAFILLFSAVFLFTSLIVIIKYCIITISGLSEPIFKLFKMLLSEEENIKIDLMLYANIIFKVLSLIISGGLIFVFSSILSTIFCCINYKICSRNHKKINHPLKFSIIKGIKWNFYRIFLVLSPPLSIKAAGGFLFFSSIILFNFFLKLAGISISLTAFVISFITFSLAFLFILSLLVSSWQLFSTLFGTEIAVSEPRLKYKIIEKRAKKLILSKQYNLWLCISYFALILIILFQIKYAFTTDLLTNSANHQFLTLIIIINLLCILIFEYLKTSGYINSLIEYSHKISKCPIKVVKN